MTGFRGKEGHWLGAGGGGRLIKVNKKTGLGRGVCGDNDLIKRKRKTLTGYAKSRHYLWEGETNRKLLPGAWLYGVHRTCADTPAVSRGTSHVTINTAVTTAVAIQKWLCKATVTQ